MSELGDALFARRREISDRVLTSWHDRSPDAADAADLRVRDDILRTTELATLAVAQYLTARQLQSEEQARVVAATGKAPLRDTIALAELAKLYLYWRDITISVLADEAEGRGFDADVHRDAATIVRAGSDGSIIRMAKQFDAERGRLQRELSIEQARLAHHAFHDVLTGLPNRRLFFDRLAHALDVRTREQRGLAVLFVDVDRFKAVNDRCGHEGGDRVLVVVAERLLAAVRRCDTVARLGGDEFVVLCEGLDDGVDEASLMAERIIRSVDQPVESEGLAGVSVSVGVAIPGPSDDADRLLRRADAAMYRAKVAGPGRYECVAAP
ncbi:MAG TPA: GGDEF domain-containing protein [Acidimicrobiia bacterium]|nr:GGDEF domain-containing protein [Acidimicrobiia bacterium]